jgi:hypothetical protein
VAIGAWIVSLAAIASGGVVAAIVLERGERLQPGAVSTLVFALICATVGAAVAVRRPGLPFGWLLLAAGLASAVAGLGQSAVTLAGSPQSPILVLGALSPWLWAASVTLIGVFLLLRFPDGRLVSRRWLILEWATAASLAISAVGLTASPGRIANSPYRNPIAPGGSLGTTLGSLKVAYVVAFFAVFATFASVVIRFRRSSRVEREQLKWIFAAAAVVVLGWLVEFVLPDILHDQAAETNVDSVVSTLTAASLPVAIGIAVLRYRLWDTDRLINRTIVYALLTVVLVAVYAGLVVGLGAVAGATGSPMVIAGSTLVVAALFGPARRRIQAVIDRRFFRRRYDAERVLAAFSSRLRDELDLESLSGELRVAVADAVQPHTVSVWIQSGGAG